MPPKKADHPVQKKNRLNIHEDIIYQSQVNNIAWDVIRKILPEYYGEGLKEGLILVLAELKDKK